MRQTTIGLLFLLPIAVLPSACGPKTATTVTPATFETPHVELPKGQPGSAEKPVPPLRLGAPAAMSDQLDGKDLKKMEVDELSARSRAAMSKGNYERAATFQYWHVQKTKEGQYDLACFLAQCNKVDAAFYWLQLAAIEEGVDTQHAKQDEDLTSLRDDPRWGKVAAYLAACNRYYETADVGQTALVLPAGYKKGTPIPAILWLHGLGSRPDGFVGEMCQDYANALNVAFIGVRGTKPRGPRSFVWAVDPEKDAARMRAAIADVSDRVTIQKGHVITVGFSQGAQVGLDVAVRNPEEYAGSIVLSAGAESHLAEVKPSPLLAKRGFVLSCGAKEHPGNVRLTSDGAAWLRKANAVVIHKPYPGVAAHSLPADFDERFPEWVKFILKTRGE